MSQDTQDSVEDLLNDEDDLEDDYNIDNDQEEKLLQEDGTDICENELSENELDESEDVLNLEVEDELEEDDLEGRRSNITGERLKTDKFVNERPPVSPINFNSTEDDTGRNKTNRKQNFQNANNFQPNRNNKGRFNKQQKWKMRSKTVHINPHFKGDVQINGKTRLKWDPPQNQSHTGHQGKGFNSFKPLARIDVWQQNHQQNVPERRFHNPPPYMGPPGGVREMPVQHYAQAQVPQMMNPAPVPAMQYNQVPPQFFQNREVFAQPPPVSVGFYQPPPQPQHVMNQQCFQAPMGPPNYCNNPVYNQPPPYSPTPQCFPYNNQPVMYNTPPPSHGDYCQTYPMHNAPPPPQPQQHPPPVSYSSSFDSNSNHVGVNNSFERTRCLSNNSAGFTDNIRVVKPTFGGQKQQQQQQQQQQKKRFTNKNFDASGHKKKRIVECSNLHEIRPVENTPAPVATEQKRNVESVMKLDDLPGLDEEYMRKIEEQKRLREEIFRKKELKRIEKAAGVAPTENNAPVTSPITKILTKPSTNFVKRQNVVNNQKNRNQQNRNLVQINQQPSSDELQNIKIEIAAQNTSRVIQLKTEEEAVRGLTKGFLSNRMVLANDHNLMHTPVVVVKNLSAGTTESKLQKMCQGIGEVQTLHLSREERQATIHFKSVASAHAFYKKYQRYMLDLSMIQVHLQTV